LLITALAIAGGFCWYDDGVIAVAAGRIGDTLILSGNMGTGSRGSTKTEIVGSVFGRDFESLARTEEEIITYEEDMLERVAERFPNAEVHFMANHRDIPRVQAGLDGNLWVTNSRDGRPDREDVLRIDDVFDTTGQWLRCVEVHNPHPDTKGRLIFLSGDRVLRRVLLDEDGGVHDEESDTETERGVICYRLRRSD